MRHPRRRSVIDTRPSARRAEGAESALDRANQAASAPVVGMFAEDFDSSRHEPGVAAPRIPWRAARAPGLRRRNEAGRGNRRAAHAVASSARRKPTIVQGVGIDMHQPPLHLGDVLPARKIQHAGLDRHRPKSHADDGGWRIGRRAEVRLRRARTAAIASQAAKIEASNRQQFMLTATSPPPRRSGRTCCRPASR